MFISDLITMVREDFTEDTNSAKYLWTDESLFRKFTEAQRQACNRANLIFDDTNAQYTQITLVSGQSSYDIDPKVTVVDKVRFDGNVILKKTKDELDDIQSTWRTDTGLTGKTVFYVISGKKLRFNYIPDADDDGKIVYLDVYRLPEDDITSDAQEPEIPTEYHRDLIWWVLYECYSKRNVDGFDMSKSNEYLSWFNQIFGEPVSAKVRQHQFESPRSLTLRPSTTSTAEVDTDW